jgi:hypothetical protein
MADMARPRPQPSSTRSSPASGSAGTPTPPKKPNTSTGKLYLEDGSTWPVGPGSVFVLPTPMRHDLENTGKATLRAVAFFAAAMFTQDFDQVMLPPKSHILGTPNRNG